MDLKVRGITLRATDYKESDRLLTVLTPERGKITVSARGIRKSGARMKGVAAPFCFADIVLAEKAGRYTLTETEVIDSFFPITGDAVKYFAGSVALEFTSVFSQENLEARNYFLLLLDFLKKLAYSSINPKNLLIKFFYDALMDMGYAINFSACGRCGEEIKDRVFLSASEGLCSCENCKAKGDREFSFNTYAYLKSASSGAEEESDGKSAVNSLKFFAYYIAEAAGVKLKSLDALLQLA